ncbi:hypothetical protein N8071_01135 [bacterium]|nr:hypothetical protein [bacterium]
MSDSACLSAFPGKRLPAGAFASKNTVIRYDLFQFFGTSKDLGRYGHFNIVKREKHETFL